METEQQGPTKDPICKNFYVLPIFQCIFTSKPTSYRLHSLGFSNTLLKFEELLNSGGVTSDQFSGNKQAKKRLPSGHYPLNYRFVERITEQDDCQ